MQTGITQLHMTFLCAFCQESRRQERGSRLQSVMCVKVSGIIPDPQPPGLAAQLYGTLASYFGKNERISRAPYSHEISNFSPFGGIKICRYMARVADFSAEHYTCPFKHESQEIPTRGKTTVPHCSRWAPFEVCRNDNVASKRKTIRRRGK